MATMNGSVAPATQDTAGLTRAKFDELQFTTLRKEIEEIKSRLFLLTIGGAALIPAAKLFTRTEGLEEITLLLPLLVCVLVLIFLSENNALMRAGSYILDHIEKPIYSDTDAQKDSKSMGWEGYLRSDILPRARRVDNIALWAFLLYALGYYIVTVYLVIRWVPNHYPSLVPVVRSGYAIVFLVMSFIVWCFSRCDTTTRPSDSKSLARNAACNGNVCGESKSQNFHESLLDFT